MHRSGPLVTAGCAVAAAVWWFGDTAPYPYAMRKLLDLPLPFLTNRRLDALLAAGPGDRILEIGPGTGLQALHVARQLGPDGGLDIVDIQQPMLDHVMRKAATHEITSIRATRADARALPFPDASFDAAYLVTALGEIPDPAATVRELRRVLKPGGRLVVGEFFDRHYVPMVTMIEYAHRSGFQLTSRLGPPFAYLAAFRAMPDAQLALLPQCRRRHRWLGRVGTVRGRAFPGSGEFDVDGPEPAPVNAHCPLGCVG